MNRLRALLADLAADGATGRVTAKGRTTGVVLLDGGDVYLAERNDRPNVLLAMADAALFTAEEWAFALRLPTREKWRALVDDDPVRLHILTTFARRYTAEVLGELVSVDPDDLTFVERVRHPFGPLAAWAVEDIVGPEAASTTASPATASMAPAALGAERAPEAEAIDRRELLEMLMEVSPLVRAPIV